MQNKRFKKFIALMTCALLAASTSVTVLAASDSPVVDIVIDQEEGDGLVLASEDIADEGQLGEVILPSQDDEDPVVLEEIEILDEDEDLDMEEIVLSPDSEDIISIEDDLEEDDIIIPEDESESLDMEGADEQVSNAYTPNSKSLVYTNNPSNPPATEELASTTGNSGTGSTAAFRLMNTALDAVTDTGTIRIVSIGYYHVSEDDPVKNLVINKSITIKGNTDTATATLKTNAKSIILGADVTIQNIKIEFTEGVGAIYANGYNLTLNGANGNVNVFGGAPKGSGVAAGPGGTINLTGKASFPNVYAGNTATQVKDKTAAGAKEIKISSATVGASTVIDAARSLSAGAAITYAANSTHTVKNAGNISVNTGTVTPGAGSTILGKANNITIAKGTTLNISNFPAASYIKDLSTAGTLTLGSGQKLNISGDVNVTGGTPALGQGVALSTATSINIESGATLTVKDLPAVTIKNLTMAGTLSLGSGQMIKVAGDLNISKTGSVPLSASGLSLAGKTSNITIASGTILNITDLPAAVYVKDFNGDGQLIIGKDQTLNISGAITGSTKFGVGSLTGTGTKLTSGPTSNTFTYINASTSKSAITGSEFVFAPVLASGQKEYNRVTYNSSAKKWATGSAAGAFEIGAVADYAYTGAAIKPTPAVSRGGVPLTLNKDYTLAYKNNINAGVATITVKGKGNYSGTATVNFNINKVPFNVSIDDITMIKTGKALSPKFIVTWNGKTLKEKKDYTTDLAKIDKIEAGEKVVTFTAIGSFEGSKTAKFIIVADKINMSTTTAKFNDGAKYTYDNGSAIQPAVTVTDKKTKQPIEDSNYTVSYENNKNPGKATAIIKGKGAYEGTIKLTFTITGGSLAKAKVILPQTSYTYTGSAIEPMKDEKGADVPVTLGDVELRKGTDYSVSYLNNINTGTGTIVLTGLNGYSGTTLKKTFKITGLTIPANAEEEPTNNIKITVDTKDKTYVKGGVKAPVTIEWQKDKTTKVPMTEGADYTLTYKNHTKAGTATVTIKGKGRLSGTRNYTYNINPSSIAVERVYFESKSYVMKPGSYKVAPIIADTNGAVLSAGTDYDKNIKYFYSNGSEIGAKDAVAVGEKITAKITAKGSYGTATIEVPFTLKGGDTGISLSAATASFTADSTTCNDWPCYYHGTAHNPNLIVKIGKGTAAKTLKKGTDYIIRSWSNNINAGTAKVEIEGMGNYVGRKVFTFKILPAVIAK